MPPEKSAPKEFVDQNLRGARFNRVSLSGAVLRGVEVADMEIDSPWLTEGDASLHVNGIDVAPFVDAELDRRFPGRGLRRAETPDDLRAAWSALERAWEGTMARVAALPEGTVEESVAGEWTFAQTLRHLVVATDTWLGKAILERDQPFHPVGLPHTGFDEEGGDMTPFSAENPSYDEVLEARDDRMRLVRSFLQNVTPEELSTDRRNPHDPQYAETTLTCVRTILEEEWEHHRYAVRDLAAIQARAAT